MICCLGLACPLATKNSPRISSPLRRHKGHTPMTRIDDTGPIPDLPPLTMPIEEAMRTQRALWWSAYHHVLGHNLGGALVVAGLVAYLAHRRWLCTALAVVRFHLHLLGDLVGARGPDGYPWPIPYLSPFSEA
jgi:inner membrane protein